MITLPALLQENFCIAPPKAAEVAALFREDYLEKGDYFLRQGQMVRKLAFPRIGHLRGWAPTADKDVTQWIFTPGYFVADLNPLFFATPARWNIQALENCQLWTLPEEHYLRMGELIPNWETLEKEFLARCFMTLEDRVFSLLSLSARERYEALLAFKPGLFESVPLHYLASMLGMTPETMSRIRKRDNSGT
ncbi:Crp/Fnr family transcriptional regulator [Neolewinella agarilytica]|uniref:cAMP-binding domain of CRP or a regulatory subunit of cAMP-dependent protein kinases n=1 Tax=Neolewinella agarilytica TaxID=478744 RepID=A0A1H9GAK2_9BACT|nr:Crp/Fnr family transcriptional regulator [Neolewinella agarilytica]SEQ47043.1 cAMP-binding domain of CRP or a regulatory subunit of cAMP-dependent protein kinases [Neolewinella agarilytica]